MLYEVITQGKNRPVRIREMRSEKLLLSGGEGLDWIFHCPNLTGLSVVSYVPLGRRGRGPAGFRRAAASVVRGVAMMEHKVVAVGVLEEGHVADAGVKNLTGKLDATFFQFLHGVITSYSIHYTKLYDTARSYDFYVNTLGLRPDEKGQSEFWVGDTCVITSYSIHYTKLYD